MCNQSNRYQNHDCLLLFTCVQTQSPYRNGENQKSLLKVIIDVDIQLPTNNNRKLAPCKYNAAGVLAVLNFPFMVKHEIIVKLFGTSGCPNQSYGSSKIANTTISFMFKISPVLKYVLPKKCVFFSIIGNSVSDAFLREVGHAISHQITNLNKLSSFLGLDHSHVSKVRGHTTQQEEHVIGLLFCWRETLQESKSVLKLRLTRAGVNFDVLLSNIPGGQTMGMIVPGM